MSKTLAIEKSVSQSHCCLNAAWFTDWGLRIQCSCLVARSCQQWTTSACVRWVSRDETARWTLTSAAATPVVSWVSVWTESTATAAPAWKVRVNDREVKVTERNVREAEWKVKNADWKVKDFLVEKYIGHCKDRKEYALAYFCLSLCLSVRAATGIQSEVRKDNITFAVITRIRQSVFEGSTVYWQIHKARYERYVDIHRTRCERCVDRYTGGGVRSMWTNT